MLGALGLQRTDDIHPLHPNRSGKKPLVTHLMGEEGLEPSRLAAHDPKSCSSETKNSADSPVELSTIQRFGCFSVSLLRHGYGATAVNLTIDYRSSYSLLLLYPSELPRPYLNFGNKKIA